MLRKCWHTFTKNLDGRTALSIPADVSNYERPNAFPRRSRFRFLTWGASQPVLREDLANDERAVATRICSGERRASALRDPGRGQTGSSLAWLPPVVVLLAPSDSGPRGALQGRGGGPAGIQRKRQTPGNCELPNGRAGFGCGGAPPHPRGGQGIRRRARLGRGDRLGVRFGPPGGDGGARRFELSASGDLPKAPALEPTPALAQLVHVFLSDSALARVAHPYEPALSRGAGLPRHGGAQGRFLGRGLEALRRGDGKTGSLDSVDQLLPSGIAKESGPETAAAGEHRLSHLTHLGRGRRGPGERAHARHGVLRRRTLRDPVRPALQPLGPGRAAGAGESVSARVLLRENGGWVAGTAGLVPDTLDMGVNSR